MGYKPKDCTRSQRGSECQFYTLRIQNVRLAKRLRGGQLSADALKKLRTLTTDLGLSLARAEIQDLEGGWDITHAGLLRLALRDRCSSIQVQAVREFCDPASSRWVF